VLLDPAERMLERFRPEVLLTYGGGEGKVQGKVSGTVLFKKKSKRFLTLLPVCSENSRDMHSCTRGGQGYFHPLGCRAAALRLTPLPVPGYSPSRPTDRPISHQNFNIFVEYQRAAFPVPILRGETTTLWRSKSFAC
jgi:hypothetical protein